MQLLLDTHAFIWFINGDDAMPRQIINRIQDTKNECFISIASIWEIAIKNSLNKLELKSGFDNIGEFLTANDIAILPLTFDHIKVLNQLDFHHRDPFDRIIIAQSISERLTIITKDDYFKLYDCDVVW